MLGILNGAPLLDCNREGEPLAGERQPPWQEPSSTGPVEGRAPQRNRGGCKKGVEPEKNTNTARTWGTLRLPTPHHTNHDSLDGAVVAGGGPRKGWRAGVGGWEWNRALTPLSETRRQTRGTH